MRHETTITREDGTVIRLIAIGHHSVFTPKPQINVFAAVKHGGVGDEVYYHPHSSSDKSLGGMTVEEYIRNGRKGLLSVVQPHEVIKATSELIDLMGPCP